MRYSPLRRADVLFVAAATVLCVIVIGLVLHRAEAFGITRIHPSDTSLYRSNDSQDNSEPRNSLFRFGYTVLFIYWWLWLFGNGLERLESGQTFAGLALLIVGASGVLIGFLSVPIGLLWWSR